MPRGQAARPKGTLPSLEQIAGMGGAELRQVWAATMERPVPKHASPELLRWALSFEQQLRASGGWPPGLVARLDALARQYGTKAASRKAKDQPPQTRLSPGMRLVRTYQGTSHEVVVLEKGFVWQGQQFSSLTEIASAISGTRWSGPLFFGLRKRKPK